MRRIRQLGLFQGLELDAEELEEPAEFDLFKQLGLVTDREDPPRADPRYDPLSDHLDEPFPEELL